MLIFNSLNFQRGTMELKKYLASRMEEPDGPVNNNTKGVHSGQGESGIIGGTGQGVNAHDVFQMKLLDYRYKCTCMHDKLGPHSPIEVNLSIHNKWCQGCNFFDFLCRFLIFCTCIDQLKTMCCVLCLVIF